ncbi:MAG: SIS domain-containing protein [Deinococcota bacterium]|jgi:D-sedoheptulose 7-phosphate isomerase|nr:SIS domain-containing protein [Deinococcota bacterium]
MPDLAEFAQARLLERNVVSRAFFAREAGRLAGVCQEMSERFLKGGRLLAFGRGPYATDAQHVSVEFVHPVIVGKRALPALDLSVAFSPWLRTLLRPEDMVMGFGPPQGDAEVAAALEGAHSQGAMTFALPGKGGNYAVEAPSTDPFIHQELIEILYHTLWETVHVFFEHRERGHDVGASGFLYPFLGESKQDTGGVLAEVTASIGEKAREVERLREQVAAGASRPMAEAALAIGERLGAGGKLIAFGNGGSATDANDLTLDCVTPPAGMTPIPAISLAMESPNISAIANDIGAEAIFSRQLIAQARSADVAVALSTSGGSKNIVMALEEARKRGLMTVALLGYDGGEVVRRKLADVALIVPSDYIPRIQEVQASLYHVLRQALEETPRGGA